MANRARLAVVATYLGFCYLVSAQTSFPPQYGPNFGQGQWGQNQNQNQNYGQNRGQFHDMNSNPNYYQYNLGGPQPPRQFVNPNYPPPNQPYGPTNYQNPARPEIFPPWTKPPEDHLPRSVSVTTTRGSITGRQVFLYDGPDVPYYERPGTPNKQLGSLQYNVSVFLGIPYAEAPLSELRFKPPRHHPGFRSLNADRYKPSCPQPTQYRRLAGIKEVSEDCLYLNVFTPNTRPFQLPYPVMIYIHGGEFEYGSANTFPAHMLAASQDVVVVTFNYRLGPLGFFSTGDDYSPGNYGMLDQVMAIKWVKENIQAFHGDPNRITLFGSGSGAASAGLHMASPLTRDIFHQVIAQSGSPLADWAAITDLERAKNTSRIFADSMGCAREPTSNLMKCLRSRSYVELCDNNIKPQLGYFPWAPIVDNYFNLPSEHKFLNTTPETFFSSRHFQAPRKRYMAGITRDEGAYLLLKDLALQATNYEITQQYYNERVMDYIRQYNYTLNIDGAYRAIMFMYTYWGDPYNRAHIRDHLINMLTDSLFNAPNQKMVDLMLTKDVAGLYMYVMNTTLDAFMWPSWRAVTHDTEFYLITGAPFMEPQYYPDDMAYSMKKSWSEMDRRMSAFLMRTYANFAKTGMPTPVQFYGINWAPMTRLPVRTLQYLNINTTDNATMMLDYKLRESAFWNEYMPFLLGPAPPTWYQDEAWWKHEQPLQIGFWSSISVGCLLFLLLLITCCLYCRAASSQDDLYYDDSIVPDDGLSNNHLELSNGSGKNGAKYETQHTTV